MQAVTERVACESIRISVETRWLVVPARIKRKRSFTRVPQ